MGKVYPVGYSLHGSDKRIDELMQEPGMLLIDTRLKPYSWRPEWRSDALRARYQGRYRVAGAFLGNLNYALKNGWPFKIAQPEIGIRGLMRYLAEGHDVILLCQCACYDNCHRKEIVRMLQVAMPEVQVELPGVASPASTLKCLSIQQPWAWLILNGYKELENRDWTTSYRGPVLIHAGARQDPDWFDTDGFLEEDHPMRGYAPLDMPERSSLYPTKRILGMATLIDVVEQSSSPWFVGRYGFVFIDAKPFKEPIPYSGSLKLFDVPREVIASAEVING